MTFQHHHIRLPHAPSFEGFDKVTILVLIGVFICLFVGLSIYQPNETYYPYLSFLSLLTLVLVGVLKAVGVFQSPQWTLGGAAAVFVGLFVLTHNYPNEIQTKKILELEKAIADRNRTDEAAETAKTYFTDLNATNWKGAVALLSTSWKEKQEQINGKGYYENVFPSYFLTTFRYEDITVKLESASDHMYSASYTVFDDVPANDIFERRKDPLTAFFATQLLNEGVVINRILNMLQKHYTFSGDSLAAIESYVRGHVTIQNLLDPYFLANLEIGLRKDKVVDLKRRDHSRNLIKRRFWHHVEMMEEAGVWKIQSLDTPFVANE